MPEGSKFKRPAGVAPCWPSVVVGRQNAALQIVSLLLYFYTPQNVRYFRAIFGIEKVRYI